MSSISRRVKRSRKGFTTSLGSLLIFSSFLSVLIPFFFYASTMNNLYEGVMVEMKDFDDQRSIENLNPVTTWPTEDGSLNVYVTNDGSLAADIVRIWIIPSNPDFSEAVFPVEEHVPPGDTLAITNDEIKDYIVNLKQTSLSVKIVTAKGNMYPAPITVPSYLSEYYKYPLVIMDTTFAEGQGSKWTLELDVKNTQSVSFFMDYIVVTAQYAEAGGHKSQVILIDYDFVFPPNGVWYFDTFEFSTKPSTNVMLIEIVGGQGDGIDDYSGMILGAYYYFIEE